MKPTKKMKDMHIVCRENNRGEKWLINGKIVPIERAEIDFEKVKRPMYITKEITK